MKDARIALRNHSTEVTRSYKDSSESDDDILLSPGKHIQSSKDSQQRAILVPKRSASPPLRDEYASHSESPSDRRALKRIKRDVDVDQDGQCRDENITRIESRPPSAHSRSASQPNMGPSSHARSGLSQPPASALRTSPVPGKDRARSVPLFPSSSSVPHIDLRYPPPSPRRTRSRSPSKERGNKLMITSGPIQVAKLETIPDDNRPETHADDPIMASSAPLLTLDDHARKNANQERTMDRRETTNDTANDCSARPSIPTVHQPPSTPATTQPLTLAFPLSPLTPLPPTPLPSSAITSSKDRHITAGREIDEDEGDDDDAMVISSQGSKVLPPEKTRNIRLPRPSSVVSFSSVTSINRPSASTLEPKSTTLMGPPSTVPAGTQFLPVGTTKPLPIAEKQAPSKPPVTNAFTVLMEQAHKGKRTDQSKRKEKTNSVRSGNSSSSLATIVPKQKGRNEEMGRPKISIKAKMRPKEKVKLKPKPISTAVSITDDDDGHSPPPRAVSPTNISEFGHLPIAAPKDLPMDAACAAGGDVDMTSPEMHSPPNAFQLDRPSTPPQTDLPVSASPVMGLRPQSNVAHVLDLSEAPTPAAIEQLTTAEPKPHPLASPIQSETSLVRSETTSTNVDIPNIRLEAPNVNSLPAPRTPASKLPLVKKIHLITATDRVTRRMSQRQREKQAETSSQAPHTAPSTHRRMIRKKHLYPVGLEPKMESASIIAQEYPQDTEVSTTSPSDVVTDPVFEEPVPPGPPMNLSSSIRRVSKVPQSRPTSSSTAKVVLPKIPSKTKFPSKPASPLSTRLVRSTSMISTRPPGGLARTFTGLSNNQGSSLSTLANALEKLRMPPPERPNTSMGFNRELDVDRDPEPAKCSADDSSIGGHVVEGTILKRTVSVESAESDAGSSGSAHTQGASSGRGPLHFEQNSSGLFSREHVGSAKLYSGSGSVMRGGKTTSSLQPRPRIFGMGTFGSGRMPKASRKTSLPSVMASPVKSNGTADVVEEADMDCSGFDAARPSHTDPLSVPGLAVGGELEPPARKSPSRRVSLASQALSQSLSSLPSKQTQVMGPPTTPPNRRPGLRSSSSSYPSSTSLASRQVPNPPVKGDVGGHVTSEKSVEHTTAPSNMAQESLKILQDCVIFVDVRTDDGDEAGSLFMEMLEVVGAKILTRVGQTCTHIIYKNGLVSTLTRYRSLRDPKPLVVGIAWVVECVEQRRRVDEAKFIVNLDGVNVAGTNKRRRSMLPKLIRREAGGTSSSDVERDRQGIESDQSMDGSSSSMIMDEELTPLELARRRRTGFRTL